MRFLIYTSALLLLTVSACKKSDPGHYMMIVTANGNTDTITNVSAQTDGVNASILASDNKSGLTNTLDITGYRQGNATYNILSTYVQGVNSSSATYRKGNFIIFGVTGNITVTGYTSSSFSGTFDFQSADGHATGTFIAPIP